MHYRIRLKGRLDPVWQDRFGVLRIEKREK